MGESPSLATRPQASIELLRGAATGFERLLVERLLRHLCQVCELPGAALYLEGEGGWQREVAVGRGGYPDLLGPEPCAGAPRVEEPGLARVELPHVRLAYPRPPVPVQVDGLLLVALAAAGQSLRLRKKLKRRQFEAAFRGVELEALYDVGLAIASTLNLEQLYEEILLRAVSLLDARRGALYLVEDASYRLERTFGGPAREGLRRGEPQVAALLAGAAAAGQDVLPGAVHLLAVPVEVDECPCGMLVVGDKESRKGVGPFPDSDRRTLALFANQAAIALETARLHRQALEKQRLERELELAAEIQRGLLPTAVPPLAGFEVRGWSRPARHVGGDLYDLLPLPSGGLGLMVADVSGKGMPAALLVSTLHSALRLLLDRQEVGPGLVERLNRHIVEASGLNRFITFLLAEVRPEGGTLHYLNAGHNPGLLVRASGGVEQLPAGGLPLGVRAGSSYRAGTAHVFPGDLLCLYSDGITECAAPDDEEFGSRRLRELLLARRRSPLEQVVAAVETAVTDFAAGLPQGDDQTVVLLRRSEG